MKTKNKSVNMNLKTELNSVLNKIEKAIRVIEGKAYEMTVTSAKDGVHMKGSKHYLGEAIDIRTRDMVYPKLVLNAIRLTLGRKFDVIYEIDHIHIEFDPK